MYLDTRYNYGSAAVLEHRRGFRDTLFQHGKVGQLGKFLVSMLVCMTDIDHVTGQLDIAGPFIALDGVNHPVYLIVRRKRVLERCAGYSNAGKDFALGGKITYPMVKQRISLSLLQAGRAADYDYGRFFRIRTCQRIYNVKPAESSRVVPTLSTGLFSMSL